MSSGQILSMTDPDRRGDTLAAAVADTDATLTLTDLTDFDEDGGWLVIADSDPIEYLPISEDDDDAGILTLATPVGATFEAGEQVDIWDPTVQPSGAKVVDYLVSVDIGHGTFPASVRHETIQAAGADNLVGAMVTLDEDGPGDWYVDQILGREPVVDLSFAQEGSLDGSVIDPATLPPTIGQTISEDAPVDIDYPEGYGWWQVVDGEAVGFWRLTGTEWVPTTIVTQDALVANNVLVEALDGKTVTGVTVQTRPEQKRGFKAGYIDGVEGLFVYDEAGNVFLKAVPAEGMAVVAGEVKATSTTVTDGASLGGITEITRHPDGSAGAVRLTAYTTAPKSAPTVTTGYDTVQFTDDGQWANRRGWSTDGTYWYTATNVGVLNKWSAAGVLVGSSFFNAPVRASVVSGGDFYVLVQFATSWWVRRYNASTLLLTGSATWTHADGTRIPAIGYDAAAGNLIIAQSRATDDKVRIRRFTWPAIDGANLDLVGTFIDSAATFAEDLAGITYGTHDFGANRYVFTGTANQQYQVLDSAGNEVSAEIWQAGMGSGKVGFAYVQRVVSITYTNGSTTVTGVFQPTDVGSAVGSGGGIPAGTVIAEYVNSATAKLSNAATTSSTSAHTVSAFKSMDRNGLLRTYTGQDAGIAIGNAVLTKWVSNTLATATLETDQSPRAQITIPKRTKLVVNTSAINTGGTNAPDRVKVYVGQGSTNPARTAMWKQTDPAVGVTATTYSSLATSGTNPPAANGFAAAGGTVQRLEQADGTVFLDGLGGGAAWTPYTPTFTAATTNPNLANFTRSGRYARTGRNTVAFSIVITCTGTGGAGGVGTGAYEIGLPPMAPRAVNEVVAYASQSAPNHMYIGRNDTALNPSILNLHLTSTDSSMSGATSGMTNGTIVRISGTYEAAA